MSRIKKEQPKRKTIFKKARSQEEYKRLIDLSREIRRQKEVKRYKDLKTNLQAQLKEEKKKKSDYERNLRELNKYISPEKLLQAHLNPNIIDELIDLGEEDPERLKNILDNELTKGFKKRIDKAMQQRQQHELETQMRLIDESRKVPVQPPPATGPAAAATAGPPTSGIRPVTEEDPNIGIRIEKFLNKPRPKGKNTLKNKLGEKVNDAILASHIYYTAYKRASQIKKAVKDTGSIHSYLNRELDNIIPGISAVYRIQSGNELSILRSINVHHPQLKNLPAPKIPSTDVVEEDEDEDVVDSTAPPGPPGPTPPESTPASVTATSAPTDQKEPFEQGEITAPGSGGGIRHRKKTSYGQKKLVKQAMKRLTILAGEIESGNKSKEIKNEIWDIIDWLKKHSYITKKQHYKIVKNFKLAK